jgi:hypothetical protein
MISINEARAIAYATWDGVYLVTRAAERSGREVWQVVLHDFDGPRHYLAPNGDIIR